MRRDPVASEGTIALETKLRQARPFVGFRLKTEPLVENFLALSGFQTESFKPLGEEAISEFRGEIERQIHIELNHSIPFTRQGIEKDYRELIGGRSQFRRSISQ